MDSIALAKIRTDGGTQMRVSINTETMLDYRDKWKSGIVFDPIDVFFDGTEYWLADGFHRFYGAREAKRKDIPAKVHNGSVRDAILFACGANTLHGLRRTNADKRQSVEVLLRDEEWAAWSNRVIAEKCGVSDPFVLDVRNQLLTVSNKEKTDKKSANGSTRRGRDGKQYKNKKRKPKATSATKITAQKTQPSENEVTPFDHLKHWWGLADETQKCLFRNWIDGNL